MQIALHNQAELPALAKQILGDQPRIVALTGPLGAGKTTLTQELGKHLGVRERITSPSFGLQHIYPAHHAAYDTLVHVDCYRLENPDRELPALDLAHWLQQPKALIVIEWAERIKNFLSDKKVMWVTLSVVGDQNRRITVR
ncbi:MAG: tRNA (adenosine(37)-N6)-threonylcarbamoyltransferase complex ATPase subunit type 1 TsaE [Patescibacteria group bacterium]